VRAVVLVGGEGTRLRPLTFTTPKQLLPVAGVPMLERVIAQLAGHGVHDVVLSLGYQPDAFLAAYPEGTVAGLPVTYAVEPEPLDTAGAIRFAADFADARDPQGGTLLVLNGDVLSDADISALIEAHRRSGAAATIGLTPVEDPSRYGVVPTDDKGRVLEFVEKPPAGTAPTNMANAGIYVLETEVLERIPSGRRVSVERDTFPLLAAEGLLFAYPSDAYWLDTGTPASYLQAQRDLLDGSRGTVPAQGAKEVNSGVWVLGEARLDGAVGPASLIGDGGIVEAGATVVASVIGAGAVVCSGALIERSVLLPGAQVESGARVSDSVLGNRSRVGAGAFLAEETLIGDDAEIPPGEQLTGGRVPGNSAA
jgi:mannose-1-phosphate guanylyltransferase